MTLILRFIDASRTCLLMFPLLTLTVSGCSLFGYDINEVEPPKMEFLELTMSRASLSSTEFEHFRIKDNLLYLECGKVNRSVFKPEDERISRFEKTQLYKTRQIASDFVAQVIKDQPTWKPPGRSNSLSDPGKLEMSVSSEGESVKVTTSLDSISDPHNYAERGLNRLVRAVRLLAGKKVCGNSEFYGLGYLR